MRLKKSILLAGNWKMNHGPKATFDFFSALQIGSKANATLRIYPPYLSLESAKKGIQQFALPIQIGSQNIHFEKAGAFTGEISGPMLTEAGISQVLIGHSERRQYFNETNETVFKKTESALLQGFEVLLCVGELLSERESGRTESVLKDQLFQILESETCRAAFGDRLHLAYEPVWAIGTGVVATPAQAQSAHSYIRGLLKDSLGEKKAYETKLLYGGSVTPGNFKALLECPEIDGGLVGGASLKSDSLQALWDLI